ncbi:MAG TPA: molybdate ABC transporter substrate-binding protein [Thermoanaerobaculia bacterium]|nr:molybdate ABC transporter substrate-binding protein [Thermoanaerobaculia bacterium]
MLRLLFAIVFAANASAAEVRVFAAASLSDALQEIARSYEQRTGERIAFNFGASSTLARQIELGAPADLFFSADEAKMDALVRRGLIDRASRASVLSNRLLIVGVASPRDLPGKRIALAEPSSVPAGIYARLWLQKAGLWEKVKANVIPTDNVRAALAAVRSGNVDAAIVYRTDVKGGYEIEDGPPISYPFAAVENAPANARRFLAYARSKPALDVFRRHGFLIR